VTEHSAERTASYEADPEQMGRVLLLYSGGLDTSVMLRWIQERYGAEIVTLTVNLGQPGEDWEVVAGKARDLGALDAIVVDAREEFAREYVLPAIKANALYGGGYPLFTALGRPLIAKIAVEQARRAASASRPSSTSFFMRRVFSRRRRSIALLRATRVIQAPALCGTPSLGQRSSATTKASCTASSAASKSPRTRIRLATARPDSWRNRRSTS